MIRLVVVGWLIGWLGLVACFSVGRGSAGLFHWLVVVG